jgi:uncharacterized protein with NRDE domain
VCTLVVAFRHVKGAPLVVAANRDEMLDRAAEGPRRWPGEPFFAPRDLVAGGTWLGLTDGGMFVGVTNRFGVAKDPARASRGALVVEALRAPTARALHTTLAALPADRYNAFHLLYADRDAAFVTWSDGTHVRQEDLAPGVHVVTERSLGGDDAGRTEAVLAAWRALGAEAVNEDGLKAMMRRHGKKSPIEGTCVHVPELGYGTRSSMILVVRDGGEARMLWAEGNPCATEYVEENLTRR